MSFFCGPYFFRSARPARALLRLGINRFRRYSRRLKEIPRTYHLIRQRPSRQKSIDILATFCYYRQANYENDKPHHQLGILRTPKGPSLGARLASRLPQSRNQYQYSNRKSYEKLEVELSLFPSTKIPFLIARKTHFVQGKNAPFQCTPLPRIRTQFHKAADCGMVINERPRRKFRATCRVGHFCDPYSKAPSPFAHACAAARCLRILAHAA